MEHIAIDTTGAVETRARFTCDPAALEAAAAYLAKRIIDRRGCIPILSYVRIIADPRGHITLTGTNLDQEASLTLSAEVESPGVFCADAAILAEMASKLRKSKDCRRASIMDNGEGRAIIYGGRGRFNVPTLPADNFPVIRFDDPLSAFAAPPQFIGDLAALSPCMEASGNKYYLHGIAIQAREMAGRDSLVMVATDGHQMGIASRPIPAGAGELADCILPDAMVAALIAARKLAGDDTPLSVESTGTRMRFTIGDMVLTSKLIDGTFPDWTRVWGEDGPLAPIEAQEALFPDLLPGAPVVMLDKLAKPFKGALSWSPSRNGQLGTVAGDPGLLFGVLNLQDDDGCGKKGFNYKSEHGEGEIIGPDGLTYPVAFSDKAIHLSAAQVRALIGETETFTATIGGKVHHFTQWLWDDGASRMGTVQPDGRCFPQVKTLGAWEWLSATEFFTRAEIEAALAGEAVEIDSQSDATGVQEPSLALDSQIAPEALSEAPSPNSEGVDIIAPETEGEGRTWHCSKNGHDTHIAATKAQPGHCWKCNSIAFYVPCPPLSGQSITHPIALARPKRTPAHERAVRLAWAMRAEARKQKQCARDAAKWCNHWHDQWRAELGKPNEWQQIAESYEADWIAACNREYAVRAELRTSRASYDYASMANQALYEIGQVKAKRRRAVKRAWDYRRYIREQQGMLDRTGRKYVREHLKRRRSTMLARDLQKRLNAEYRMADKRSERNMAQVLRLTDERDALLAATERLNAKHWKGRDELGRLLTFERNRADTLAAQLAKAGETIAELRAKVKPPLSRFMASSSPVALRVAA